MFKNPRALVVVLSSLYWLAMGSAASPESATPRYEQALNEKYSWVMFVNVESMDDFLDYKQSPFHPLKRCSVAVRRNGSQMMRYAFPMLCSPTRYEELWYRGAQCIGLKRYCDTPVQAQQEGAIYVRSSDATGIADNTQQVTNCLTRLILEVFTKHGFLGAIFVPENCVEQITSNLSSYNFEVVQQFRARNPGLALHLIAYPSGVERYFCYHDISASAR